MELSLLIKSIDKRKPVQTQIGELVLDAALEEFHSYASQVTSFPVEDGSTITDHVYNEPVKVTIKGVVSNNPLPQAGESFYGELDKVQPPMYRAQAAFGDLIKIRDDRQPVTIVTGLAVYNNMILNSINVVEDDKSGDCLEFTADFTQIKIVKSGFVQASSLKAEAMHASGKMNAGKKTPKELDKEQSKAVRSSKLSEMYKKSQGLNPKKHNLTTGENFTEVTE